MLSTGGELGVFFIAIGIGAFCSSVRGGMVAGAALGFVWAIFGVMARTGGHQMSEVNSAGVLLAFVSSIAFGVAGGALGAWLKLWIKKKRGGIQ